MRSTSNTCRNRSPDDLQIASREVNQPPPLIGTIPLFSGGLILLLALRILLDRLELGAVVAVMMLGLAALALVRFAVIPKRIWAFAIPLLLVVGWGYANAVYIHEQPVYALRGVIRYVTYLAVMIVAYVARPRISTIFGVYTLVVLAQFIFSLIHTVLLGFDGRPPGTLINSNHVSYLLVLYFSLSLFYFRDHFRALLTLLFSLYLGGLGGLIALITVAMGYLLTRASLRIRLASIVLGPMLLAITITVLADRIIEQGDIVDVESRIQQEQAGGGGSLTWRVVTWKLMLDELNAKRSLLSGQGLEYASIASPYFLSASIREPHNDYVRILLEVGLFGLAAYLVIYGRALWGLLKHRNPYGATLSASLGWTLVGLGLGQLVGNIVTQSTLWWFFFAFAGAHLARQDQFRRPLA